MSPTFNLQDRIVLTLLAQTPLINIRLVCSFTLSLHVVGIVVCLVTLHTKSVRRASHCPLYRVRNFLLAHRQTTLPSAFHLIISVSKACLVEKRSSNAPSLNEIPSSQHLIPLCTRLVILFQSNTQ